MSVTRPAGWQIFRQRNFRSYVSARFFANMATQIQTVGVGLYVYELTRDPLALGMAGFFTFAPQLLLLPFTGYVADRYDRRRVSAATYAIHAASSIGLLVFVLSGSTSVVPVYVMVALTGVARAFGMPANQAMLPGIVTVEQRQQAIAWSASTTQFATISGPTVGGLIYVAGADVVFVVAGLIHALAVMSISLIAGEVRVHSSEPFTWAGFLQGLSFIRSREALFASISLDLVAVLFGGVAALWPIYAAEILNVGPSSYGLLRSSQALGALTMALFLAQYPIRQNAGRWLLTAVGIYGASIVVFGLSTTLWLSLVCLFIEGAADMVSVVIRLAIVQNETPDDMRGKVASMNSLFIGASNSLGDFEAGLTASWFGVVPATVLGGSLSIATALIWSRAFPELRRRQTL